MAPRMSLQACLATCQNFRVRQDWAEQSPDQTGYQIQHLRSKREWLCQYASIANAS